MSPARTTRLPRRTALKLGAAALLGASGPMRVARALEPERAARPGGPRALLCIQLEGGADGLSVLPPVGEAALAGLRRRTHVHGLPLDEHVGLHPALSPLSSFYVRGELLAITALGDARARGSHLSATRAFADALGSLPWRGEALRAADVSALGAARDAPRLSDALERAADVLARAGEPRAVLVRVPGFDTHLAQGTRLGRALEQLGAGLERLPRQLGSRFANTIVWVTSERGRSVAENATAGTEDGLGGAGLLLGADVAGGRVTGEWPDLTALRARGDRHLEVRVEHAAMAAELGAWLRGESPQGGAGLVRAEVLRGQP